MGVARHCHSFPWELCLSPPGQVGWGPEQLDLEDGVLVHGRGLEWNDL